MDVGKVAVSLNVSAAYVYSLVDRREIGCYRLGRRILFSKQQIDDYLASVLVSVGDNPGEIR